MPPAQPHPLQNCDKATIVRLVQGEMSTSDLAALHLHDLKFTLHTYTNIVTAAGKVVDKHTKEPDTIVAMLRALGFPVPPLDIATTTYAYCNALSSKMRTVKTRVKKNKKATNEILLDKLEYTPAAQHIDTEDPLETVEPIVSLDCASLPDQVMAHLPAESQPITTPAKQTRSRDGDIRRRDEPLQQKRKQTKMSLQFKLQSAHISLAAREASAADKQDMFTQVRYKQYFRNTKKTYIITCYQCMQLLVYVLVSTV